MIFSLFVTNFISMFIYPGPVSEIQYCNINDWTPIVLVVVFSVVDIFGRVGDWDYKICCI